MKKYISVLIITALLLASFAGFGRTALAGPGDASISLSPDTVAVGAGDTANVTATITNNTGESFTSYRVKVGGTTTFGDNATLASGDIGEISVSFAVTESMLNNNLTFTAEYKTASTGDSWQEGDSASLRISGKGQTAAIACTATADQTLVAPGDQVTFSFNIENQGDVTLENIEVKADNISRGNALTSAFSLNPGKSFTKTYKYTFTAPVTVKFYITYTVNGSSQKYDIPQQFELKSEERMVKASLSADDSTPEPGQEVTFSLKITNEGNVSYTNLTVTWDGEDVGSPSRNLNPGDVLEKQYKRTFDTSTDVRFTITMKDHTGSTVSVNTNTVQVLLPVDPAALQGGLKLVIEPDRNEFSSVGVVNFSGYISNDSEYTLSEVSVTESSLGSVFSVSEMAGNTKLPISFSADINETATYNFVFSVKDRNGQVYTVNAEPITVTIQNPEEATVNPIDGAPVVTLPPDNGSSDPLGIWFIIAGVLVVLILGVGAALFVLWRNGRSPSRASSSSRASMAPKAKRPTRGGYSKSIRSRSFRDRNNF